MSLPREFRPPEFEDAHSRLRSMSPEEFSALTPLSPTEHQLIGGYIQAYSFIDFNLRRSVEVFWHAKMLPPTHVRRYPRFKDAELSAVVNAVVTNMDSGIEDIENSSAWLAAVDRGRPFRNLISHFAAKRMGADFVVFASKDERDAERTLGRRLNKAGVLTAMTTVAALQDLAAQVGTLSYWVAAKFPEWFRRYSKE